MTGAAWTSPLLQLGGRPDHALAATYGVLLATVLGAMGLPHILVRFYTNRDGQAARRTTAFVLLLLGCFYVFPAVFAVLGRMEAPASTRRARPIRWCSSCRASWRPASWASCSEHSSPPAPSPRSSRRRRAC